MITFKKRIAISQPSISYKRLLQKITSLFPPLTLRVDNRDLLDYTFLSTNEKGYREALSSVTSVKSPSILFATSVLQGLTFATVFKPDMTLIIDHNPFVIAKLQIIFDGILVSDTKEKFLAFLREKSKILRALQSQEDDDIFHRVLRRDYETLQTMLQGKQVFGWTHARDVVELKDLGTKDNEIWLQSDESYAFVRAQVEKGLIQAVCGSYTDADTFQKADQMLTENGIHHRILYESNIKDHLRSDEKVLDVFQKIIDTHIRPEVRLYTQMSNKVSKEQHGKLEVYTVPLSTVTQNQANL